MAETEINKAFLQNLIYQFLRAWPKPEPDSLALMAKLHYYRQLTKQNPQASSQSAALARQLLDKLLETLAERYPEAADLLRQRFFEGTAVKILAQQLAVSESQFYNLQQEALAELAGLLLSKEEQARFEYQLVIEARLEPIAHQQLFGVAELQRQLRALALAPTNPWLIALVGLGGIGKTSLADRLVRDLAATTHFVDIAWVSARREIFSPAAGIRPASAAPEPAALTAETLIDLLLAQLGQIHSLSLPAGEKAAALARLLRQQPYLVVVDNLETAADYEALIPVLRQLAGPSKFLLTSRYNLQAYADIFCLNVTELNEENALAFLRYEVEQRNLQALLEADLPELSRIYQVVGGNPLALKLVLGQIYALPLPQVLENLKQAQGRKINELYTYIYRHSWQALSPAGRQVLLALPVASPRGSTLEHLLRVSGLEAGALSQALEELIHLSLVEVGGDLAVRRYSIHHLTETFLLTEIAQWPLSP